MKIGKVTENVLKRSVLRQIHSRREEVLHGAGIGEDCAIFTLSEGETGLSCMQDTPVREPGDVAMAVQKGANNIAACGGSPVAVMITLLLPEDAEESGLKAIMAEAEKACQNLNTEIMGGQTRVTPAVKVPYAVITTYGKADANGYRTAAGVAPGQDIVISKWIGLEGTAKLARQYKDKILERYPAYLAETATSFDSFLSIIPEAATAMKSGVCAMHDASEGGILAALWEMAEGAGVGLTIELKKLPLRQETVEVCECLGKNPYELLSGGSLIMTTEDGIGLVAALEEQGIPAVIVGKVTDSNDRIIRNDEEVRYMDRPKQDEIYKKEERYQ